MEKHQNGCSRFWPILIKFWENCEEIFENPYGNFGEMFKIKFKKLTENFKIINYCPRLEKFKQNFEIIIRVTREPR